MLHELEKTKQEAEQEIKGLKSLQEWEALRIKYLGRKGKIAAFSGRLKSLPKEQKPQAGKLLNQVKKTIQELLQAKKQALGEKQGFVFDMHLPVAQFSAGSLHPLTVVMRQLEEVFYSLGFKFQDGGEIEDEEHKFEALNISLQHSARDMFDTFYLEEGLQLTGTQGGLLLRSHTSPTQVRVMRNAKPPLAVISFGRVYRPDAVDATHSFMFHQLEGFAVDKDLRFSDLKGMLLEFARRLFGANVNLRFRPSFFPFTEPSAEVDISCIICQGKGCNVCKNTGWLEVLGCGMIHPNVFKSCGIDSEQWQGYAFGMGIERIAMLKYRIDDIRYFYNNHKKFLEQFYGI